MAVKRANLMDAVTTTAATVARSRTAVVRRGKVTVAPDGTGLTKVALGGGTVDAMGLKTGVLAVNDQVAVVADTDAYWIAGVIGASTAPAPANSFTKWNTEADFGSPAAGYTRQLTEGFALIIPSMITLCQFQTYWTNTNAVTIPANGRVDVAVGTLPAGMRPGYQRHLLTHDVTSGAMYWTVQNDGLIRWTGGIPGLVFGAGGGRYMTLFYCR